jgi:hypothetical protein
VGNGASVGTIQDDLSASDGGTIRILNAPAQRAESGRRLTFKESGTETENEEQDHLKT